MEGNRERGWPSPRTWERVSLELELAEKNNLDRDLLHVIVEGLVGKGPALEFMAFIDWSAKVPDIKKMLDGEIPVKVQKDQIRDMRCYLQLYTTFDNSRIPKKFSMDFLTLYSSSLTIGHN